MQRLHTTRVVVSYSCTYSDHIHGLFFFERFCSSLLFTALTAMAEISGLFIQRRIIHRHKNGALYHPFVEALAFTLVDVPITFVILVVFGIIIYFMVGLQRSAVSHSSI